MKVANLNEEALNMLSVGLDMIKTMKMNEDYLDCVKAIMGLMEMFEEDEGFHAVITDLRDETINLWRKKINKNKK